MRLPNFLFIGAAKCGSTWFYQALRAHPQVYVPVAKDIYFFDQHYDRGLDWYAGFFAQATESQTAVGEVSHDYLFSAEAAHRIQRDLPGVRLIMSLRDPIDRALSVYQFRKRNRTASGTFRETAESAPNMVARGRYLEPVRLYLEVFPRERVRVFLFDELKADPERLARQLYEFLGVDASFQYDAAGKKVLPASRARSPAVAYVAKRAARLLRRHGQANLVGRLKGSRLASWLYRPLGEGEKATLTPQERAWLREVYREDVGGLQRLIERDLSHWLRQDGVAGDRRPVGPAGEDR
jgi:hypothetical protein